MALQEFVSVSGKQRAWVSDPATLGVVLDRVVHMLDSDRSQAVEKARVAEIAKLAEKYPNFSQEYVEQSSREHADMEGVYWEPTISAVRSPDTDLRGGTIADVTEVAKSFTLKRVDLIVGPSRNRVTLQFSRDSGVRWTVQGDDEARTQGRAIALANMLKEHRPWYWWVYTIPGQLVFNYVLFYVLITAGAGLTANLGMNGYLRISVILIFSVLIVFTAQHFCILSGNTAPRFEFYRTGRRARSSLPWAALVTLIVSVVGAAIIKSQF